MKVGFYAPSLPATKLGAPGSYFMNLARELLDYEEIELYFIHEYNNMGSHPMYFKTRRLILPKIPLFNSLTLKKHKLDIIHFNGILTTPKPMTLASPYIRDIKKIATVHGDVVFSAPSFFGGVPHVATRKRILQPLVANWLDKLIPVSRDLGERLIKYLNVPRDKLHPVYPGINQDIFRPIPNCKSKLMEKYSLKGDFLLHVSNYSPRKNPKALFKTFKRLIDEGFNLDMVILGKGWKGKARRFLRRRDKKLQEKIKVLGFVPLKDLPVFYSAAELFFFPTHHENFGFPNLEAMACGTPVVTSNVYTVPEVTDDAAILCNSNNIPEFLKAIKRILENNKLKEEMREKGLKHVKKFTWEKCAKATIKVYEEVSEEL